MIYLDSSALVKLALVEPETAALARWLAERADQPLISSALYRAEVPRAIWRAEPGALPRSYRMLKRIARVALTPDVLDNSATLPPRGLSAAQAIHLASALAVKRDLSAFVAYDERLLAAAKDAGLPVAAPGSPRLSPEADPGSRSWRQILRRAPTLRGEPGGRGQAAGPFRKKRTFCATNGRAASSLKSARRQAGFACSGGPDAAGARPGQSLARADPSEPAGIRRFRSPGRNVVDVAVSHGCSAGRPDRPRHGAHAGRQTHAASRHVVPVACRGHQRGRSGEHRW